MYKLSRLSKINGHNIYDKSSNQRRSTDMKKMNMKTKRVMLISTFLVIGIALVGAIYIKTNTKNMNEDILIREKESDNTVVDTIEEPGKDEEKIEVPEIREEEVIKDIDNKVEKEVIEEPLPKEPEKPKSTPPEKKPQTKDDVEDITKEPEYDKEEVIYIPEEKEEPQTEKDPVPKDNEEDNLVPESENPFLQDNIPNNGDGGEMKLDDVTDHVPGTGDKF